MHAPGGGGAVGAAPTCCRGCCCRCCCQRRRSRAAPRQPALQRGCGPALAGPGAAHVAARAAPAATPPACRRRRPGCGPSHQAHCRCRRCPAPKRWPAPGQPAACPGWRWRGGRPLLPQGCWGRARRLPAAGRAATAPPRRPALTCAASAPLRWQSRQARAGFAAPWSHHAAAWGRGVGIAHLGGLPPAASPAAPGWAPPAPAEAAGAAARRVGGASQAEGRAPQASKWRRAAARRTAAAPP